MRLILPLLLVLSVHAEFNGLTVETQQGLVSGSFSDPSVRQFLGIPFAAAGRWQAPQAPPIRKSVLKATSFGDSCVQDLGPSDVLYIQLAGWLGLNTTESENCLTVNIWSPGIGRKQKTAVLLWIFGGGTVFGTTNIPMYDGTNFVRDNDDITIVTFNYRLNIFGQPNSPQLVSNSASQNFGVLDLEAAVTWVHNNIANFGGDPNRIVLFGQSAGAASADLYTFAYPDDTRVKGIITQSGTALLEAKTTTILDPTPWNTVAAAVGCGSDITTGQFECMQAVPFRRLEDAVINTNTLFNPVVDNINVFSDTAERSAAGNFSRIPVLDGTTANENDIFLLIQELLTTGISTPTISEMLSDVMTLAGFTCSARTSVIDRISNGVPTWKYQYQGVFPSISNRPELRAYHGADVPLVFGTYNESRLIPATANQVGLSQFMQKSWVAFARDPQKGKFSVLAGRCTTRIRCHLYNLVIRRIRAGWFLLKARSWMLLAKRWTFCWI